MRGVLSACQADSIKWTGLLPAFLCHFPGFLPNLWMLAKNTNGRPAACGQALMEMGLWADVPLTSTTGLDSIFVSSHVQVMYAVCAGVCRSLPATCSTLRCATAIKWARVQLICGSDVRSLMWSIDGMCAQQSEHCQCSSTALNNNG